MNETEDKVNHLLKRARCGAFGSPDSPKRSASIYESFWRGYFGWVKPAQVKNSTAYPAVKAGQLYYREQK